MAGLQLKLDPSGIVSGGAVAENALDGVTAAAVKTQAGVTGVAAKSRAAFSTVQIAAGAIIGVLAGIGSAVSTIRQFETGMSKLSAVTGATTSQLRDMRDMARDLGASTEFSATQAADALTFLGMAGFTASEGMESIATVLDLATASGMSLAAAADTASNIMSGFGIEAENAAQVSDVLAAASSRANTTVSQLGQAMSTVAPIAAALDIGLEDTAAAIGIMSDAGIQGERAGTALRGVLAALAGPTTEATKVLRSLGLSISDIDPATNSLAVVMDRLAKSGISTADAMSVFGREAASGALVLINGKDRLSEFGDELRHVDGAASEMATTMRDNLGGDIDGLKSAISGLIISLGDAGLTGALRIVVSLATGVTRSVTAMVDAFGNVGSAILSLVSMGKAVDNVTLAMGDEIRQANSLFTLMGTGNSITQSAALAKLSEARTHLRNAEAIREERDAAISLQMAQLTLEYQRRIEARNAQVRNSGGYEEQELAITSILGKMRDLNALADEGARSFKEAEAEVARIKLAIENAVDGMVTFDGELVTANSLSQRLSITLDGMQVDGAIAGVSILAHDLGVSLEQALKLNAALDRAAGISSEETPGGTRGLSFGLPGTGVGPSATSLGFGNTNINPTNIRGFNLPDRGAIGGGTGGGGTSRAVEKTRAAYDSLRASLDPLVAAELNLAKAQDTVNEALANGFATVEQGSAVMDLAQQRYNEAIGKSVGYMDELKNAGATALDRLIDGTTSLTDALKDMIRELGLAILKKQLLGSVSGGAASMSIGGLLMQGLTGGFMDSGGMLGMGESAVVGEKRPEVITATTRGVQVMGGADTARRLGGRDGGQQNINVSVGVTVDKSGDLRAYVKSVAAASGKQAYDAVKSSIPSWNQQINTDGVIS